MSIWFELMALSLAAYAIGLLLGWLIWGNLAQASEDIAPNSGQTEPDGTISTISKGKVGSTK